jgi:hypothetical protein
LKESVDSELKIERRLLFPGVDNLLVGAEEEYAEPGVRARYSQTKKQIPSWSSEL